MKMKMPAEGQLAQSLQGRDKGKYYIVASASGNRVNLVDGKTRKLLNPKVKNLKHLYFLPVKAEIKKDGAYDNSVARFLKEQSLLKGKSED